MTEQTHTLTSAAAERGPLAMEAVSVSKDFKLGHGQTLHAVRNVSFNLYRGAVVALVGESGSGKSTAARLLAGQERLTSGAVKLDGKPVAVTGRSDFRRYKSQVQYVFQDPFASLNPVHTVRYHLERPVKLHHGRDTNVDTEVVALMEQVRLTPAKHFLDKYPHELSGGQRQRVAIARALAVRPRVLLADEPVSMLDVSIRLGVLNLLADIRDNEGLAVLYVTHDIASARYLGDTIAVMYAGQIIEQGPAVTVTDEPAHPYTQLLLAAAPDPDRNGPQAQLNGRGGAPSLVTPPSGCRFHPRCPYAMAICSAEAPPSTEVAPGHVSACWLHTQTAQANQTAQTGQTGTPKLGNTPEISDNDPPAGTGTDTDTGLETETGPGA